MINVKTLSARLRAKLSSGSSSLDEPEDQTLPHHILEIIEQVRPYTMTSPARIAALVEAIEYIVQREVPGAIVECGVWKGGSVVAAILTLQHLGVGDR